MKVESSKTNEANRQNSVSKSSASSGGSIYQTTNNLETPAPSGSAFAKILEEARKNSGKEDDSRSKPEKSRTTENSRTGASSDGEDSSLDSVQNRESVEEKEKHKGESGGDSNDSSNNDQTAFAALGMIFDNRQMSENSIPAARSIVHVADLERIVAAVRMQNLENSKQLVLTLKNSVLEGLQIKISLDENGKYKAEFLAGSEQIKKQIEARKSELLQIFRDRGLNFTGLDVKQNSDFSNSSGRQETLMKTANEKNISQEGQTEIEVNASIDDDVTYRV